MGKLTSRDGTTIAYEKVGSGPAIILVDGAFCSKAFGPMPKIGSLLSQRFTVYLYDRRGRGESGDSKPYAVEREIEDIAELIKTAGGSACLFGISSGAILCLQAAATGLAISKLAIFEPPFVGNKDGKRPKDAIEQLARMVGENRRGDAVKFYLTKVMGAPAIAPFFLRLTPNWSKMKANATALPYDLTICGDFEMPGGLVGSIRIPTLVIDSTKSPEPLRNAVDIVSKALPFGERKSLHGSVHDVPAKVLVPVLTDFYNK